MNIQELLNSNEVQWLFSKGEEMVDFDNNKKIAGSRIFNGRLPKNMVQALRSKLDKTAKYTDCGAKVIYSVSTGDTEKDFGYTFEFGTFKSNGLNIKFTACPYTW